MSKFKIIFLINVIFIISLLSSLNVFASSNDSYFTIPGDNLWHYTDTRLKENTSYVYFKARSDGTAEYGEYYEVALDTGHGWDRTYLFILRNVQYLSS